MASLIGLQPWLRPWAGQLLDYARRRGFPVVLTSVLRSRVSQARLYRDYISGKSTYPAAPPGHSMHELGRAFDVAADQRVLAELGKVWQQWGGTWGQKFGDPIHFEA